MNQRDPEFWRVVMSPELRAALMAVVIAWLRIAYDGHETKWQRVALESVLCGALSYGISSGLAYFDSLPVGVSVFAGATVGFLGVDFVRNMGKKYVEKRIDKDDGLE